MASTWTFCFRRILWIYLHEPCQWDGNQENDNGTNLCHTLKSQAKLFQTHNMGSRRRRPPEHCGPPWQSPKGQCGRLLLELDLTTLKLAFHTACRKAKDRTVRHCQGYTQLSSSSEVEPKSLFTKNMLSSRYNQTKDNWIVMSGE